MAGINFNNLPKDLQAKLEPYMTIGGAKTVEEAVKQAKDAKAWTADDDKRLNSLNGGANWGRTMDEYAFDSSKAAEYKADLPRAQKENHLAQARRKAAWANEFNAKNEEQQAELDKKRAELTNAIAEKKSQGFLATLTAIPDAFKLNMLPKNVNEQKAGSTLGKYVAAGAMVAYTLLNVQCGPLDKPETININASNNAVINLENASSYQTQIAQIVEALNKIIARMDKMEANYDVHFKNLLAQLDKIIGNQESTKADFDKALKDIISWLEKIHKKGADIQTDGNNNAETIIELLKAILNGGGNMDDKLQKILDLLGEIKTVNETILSAINTAKDEILAKLGENNAAVLEAINKLDTNDQNTLAVLNDIKAILEGCKEEGKAFAEAILVALGQTGGSGKDYTDLLNDIIDLLKNIDSKSDTVIGGMNAILDAIKGLPDYSAKLDAIIEKLNALGDKADEILKAIKDHDVKITVDVTGKVQCECNCNCGNGTVHEGILGDLSNLLL